MPLTSRVEIVLGAVRLAVNQLFLELQEDALCREVMPKTKRGERVEVVVLEECGKGCCTRCSHSLQMCEVRQIGRRVVVRASGLLGFRISMLSKCRNCSGTVSSGQC